MTIDKAIEILHNLLTSTRCRWEPDKEDAIKLGYEALKLIKLQRQLITRPSPPRLPGETKD